MRAAVIGLLLSAMLARHASAYDAHDPANCNGADWDDKLALTLSKVTAQPRVNGAFRTSHDASLKSTMRSKADIDYANRLAPACVNIG
jgi:hypothetical protein